MANDTSKPAVQDARPNTASNPPPKASGTHPSKAKTSSKLKLDRDNGATNEPAAVHPTVAAAVQQAVHGAGNDFEAAAASDPTVEEAGPRIGARPTIEELEAAVDGGPIGSVGKVEEVYERREPRSQAEFIRTHPNLDLWIETVLLVDKEGFDKPVWLVGPMQRPLLQSWLKRALLVPTVNQDGEFFIWPIIIADITLGQRSNRTEAANREIAQRASKEWVCRVFYRGKHVAVPADDNGAHLGDKGQPQFPEGLTRKLILERTFTGAFINHNDHEMVRIYRGRTKR
jgi:hypothetical protein